MAMPAATLIAKPLATHFESFLYISPVFPFADLYAAVNFCLKTNKCTGVKYTAAFIISYKSAKSL